MVKNLFQRQLLKGIQEGGATKLLKEGMSLLENNDVAASNADGAMYIKQISIILIDTYGKNGVLDFTRNTTCQVLSKIHYKY